MVVLFAVPEQTTLKEATWCPTQSEGLSCRHVDLMHPSNPRTPLATPRYTHFLFEYFAVGSISELTLNVMLPFPEVPAQTSCFTSPLGVTPAESVSGKQASNDISQSFMCLYALCKDLL